MTYQLPYDPGRTASMAQAIMIDSRDARVPAAASRDRSRLYGDKPTTASLIQAITAYQDVFIAPA